MHKFDVIKHLSVAFLQATIAIAQPLTLYRIGELGRDQPGSGIISQAPLVTALGVRPDGGTRYEQYQEVYIGETTFVTGTPPTTTTSTYVGEETAVFVQHASWAYRQVEDQSGRFPLIELNCTIPTEGKEGSECVEVVRLTRGASGAAPTTTVTSTSTFPGTLVGRFTATGPIPSRTNGAERVSGSRPLALILMGCAVLAGGTMAW